MTFSDLPTEIISRILTHLTIDGDVDFASLSNVRLCCQRLNLLAQPMFYSSFEETSRNSLVTILREASRDDRISKYCESFSDGSLTWWRNQFPVVDRVLDIKDEEIYKTIFDGHVGHCLRATYDRAAEHGSKHPSEIVEDLKEDDSRSLATLALLSLPAVQHFQFGMSGLSAHDIEYLEENPGLRFKPRVFNWMVWLFQRAGDLQNEPKLGYFMDVGNLHNMRSIDIRLVRNVKMATSRVMPFLSLKSVRRFNWVGVDLYWDMPARMRLSNMRSLHLSEIALTDEGLGKLMSLFTALETLELQTGLFIKVATHIKHLKHCLRKLILRNTYGPQAYVQKPSQRSSYEGFNNLEVLEVAAPHIDGWVSDLIHQDHVPVHEAEMTLLEFVIPSSVKELTISCCGKRVLQKVRALLLSDWQEHSSLRRVVLNCHWKYKTWVDGVKEEWQKDCEAVGIKMIVDYRYFEPKTGMGFQSYV